MMLQFVADVLAPYGLTQTVPDRRTKARFEVVGRLPGTLTNERPVHLLNVSLAGALIETAAPLQPETVFTVTLQSDHHLATLRARVCHVNPTHLDDGFVAGLEFLGGAPEDLARLLHIDPHGDDPHGDVPKP